MAMKGNKPPRYGICIYIYIIPEMAIDDMTKGIWKEMANEHCSEPLLVDDILGFFTKS